MQTASKKITNGWAMYDWANSVYNLVITTTFFPIYFLSVTNNKTNHTVIFLGRKFINSSLYDYILGASYLMVSLLYPILTSIADTNDSKKKFMRFFCYMGALGCALLFFFKSNTLTLGIIAFIMASIGYAGSLVFYNAYLPEIAAPDDRDRISAKGFSYGYIGSVLMQLIGFLLITIMSNQALATRITFLLVGCWWVGFAQITFFHLPASTLSNTPKGNIFKNGFVEIKKVYIQVQRMPVFKNFLRGFFFYSMGVQTVMLAATLFGSKVLNLPDAKLIITIVLIQLVAIAGAWYMARLSAKFGNLKVLIGIILFWIGICIAAYYTAIIAEKGINAEYYFYVLATGVGLIMGGVQSLSRSTFAKLMPKTRNTASFFSYYDFTEKIAIVIGIFIFGFIEEKTGSMKNAILSLIVFFVIGILWLLNAHYLQQKPKIIKA